MSIENELQRIINAKQSIIQAIIEKGVTVPEEVKLEDLANLIGNIETGGSVRKENILGRDYIIVDIGNYTWMAENLDYKIDGMALNPNNMPTTPAAWYFNRDESTYGWNGKKYGLLYNAYCIDTLKELLANTEWKVPDYGDFYMLQQKIPSFLDYGVGKALKSTSDWNDGGSSNNGVDKFGFNLLPAGCHGDGDFWPNTGTISLLWVDRKMTDTTYDCRKFDYDSYSMDEYTYNMIGGCSIRLVKKST